MHSALDRTIDKIGMGAYRDLPCGDLVDLFVQRPVSVGIARPMWLWYVFCGVGQACVRPTYSVFAGWAADNVTISYESG